MKIVVNGQMINYSDEGSGRVVVMLHGWGANLGTFDALASVLAKEYRVIRIDFPGFGSSPVPDRPWSVGDYAKNLQAFLIKHEVPDVYAIVAHSFGGRIAMKSLGSNQLSVKRLVLVGSGGIKHSASFRQQFYKGVAKAGGAVAKLPVVRRAHSSLRKRLYNAAGASDYLESGELKQTFLLVINEDLQEYARKITTKTLLLWGENDDQTPVADANLLNEGIKGSRLVVYPGAGHFTYLDEPTAVLAEIERFLS